MYYVVELSLYLRHPSPACCGVLGSCIGPCLNCSTIKFPCLHNGLCEVLETELAPQTVLWLCSPLPTSSAAGPQVQPINIVSSIPWNSFFFFSFPVIGTYRTVLGCLSQLGECRLSPMSDIFLLASLPCWLDCFRDLANGSTDPKFQQSISVCCQSDLGQCVARGPLHANGLMWASMSSRVPKTCVWGPCPSTHTHT